jgi:hypothetical protein
LWLIVGVITFAALAAAAGGYLIAAFADNLWPWLPSSPPTPSSTGGGPPISNIIYPGAQGISALPPMDASAVFYLSWTTLSTSPVSSWLDSSGNARTFTQSDTSHQPTFTPAKGVQFTEGHFLVGPNVFPSSSDYTIVVVGSFPTCFNSLSSGCVVVGSVSSGHAFYFTALGGNLLSVIHGSATLTTSNVTSPLNTTVILEFVWSAASFTGTYFINGINCGTTTHNALAVVGDPSVTIGGWEGGGVLTGSVLDVILYASALNDSFRALVEGWYFTSYNLLPGL